MSAMGEVMGGVEGGTSVVIKGIWFAFGPPEFGNATRDVEENWRVGRDRVRNPRDTIVGWNKTLGGSKSPFPLSCPLDRIDPASFHRPVNRKEVEEKRVNLDSGALKRCGVENTAKVGVPFESPRGRRHPAEVATATDAMEDNKQRSPEFREAENVIIVIGGDRKREKTPAIAGGLGAAKRSVSGRACSVQNDQ